MDRNAPTANAFLTQFAVLSDEIETNMRLLGVNKLSDLSPHYVNTKELEHYLVGSIDGKETKARL